MQPKNSEQLTGLFTEIIHQYADGDTAGSITIDEDADFDHNDRQSAWRQARLAEEKGEYYSEGVETRISFGGLSVSDQVLETVFNAVTENSGIQTSWVNDNRFIYHGSAETLQQDLQDVLPSVQRTLAAKL